MNHAKLIASAGTFLLATSALTTVASAQVVFNGNSATTSVSSSYGVGDYYDAGSYTTGYVKAEPYPSYLMAPQAAAVPYPAQMPTQAPYVDPYAAPYVDPYAASYVDPYAAVAPASAYGAGYDAAAAASASASATVVAPVPQYIDHTHDFQQHDHQLVEHSHGYEAHQHSPEQPGAHYHNDAQHSLLGENVVINELVMSGASSDDDWEDDWDDGWDDGSADNIPSYDDKDDVIIIDDSPHYGGPTRENALRLSAGYGYAFAGNLGYGIQGNYYDDSADPADWTSTGSESYTEGTHWIDEELQHRGIYGSLKGDIGNFFIDAVGGIYSVNDYEITKRFNLAEAYNDSATGNIVGALFPIIDGTPGYFTGHFAYTGGGDGTDGAGEYDSLDLTATINSQINDFGGAAGYSLNIPGVPLKVGLGVAGKSLSRTTTVELEGTVNEVSGGELFVDLTSFDDHTYTEEVAGTYVGPAVRVNFDPVISSTIGLHFGGSVQALYGNSNMTVTQENDLVAYTVEDSTSGFVFAGEIDAGLSLAVSPNIQIGAGVFAGMTSGAPIVTNTTVTNPADSPPVAVLGQGSWQNYGLKGAITARF